MEKKYDVCALGELLIDFIPINDSVYGNPQFEANPGGAPCNVLAMLEKLERKTIFIGKVGHDGFGRQLRKAIQACGIDDSLLYEDKKIHTTLAFVHKTKDGDRDFSFYRQPGADMMLNAEEVDENIISATKIFHFGSLSLTDEPILSATEKALKLAEKYNILRSYDPNLRLPLWHSEEQAKEMIAYGMANCDILKIADNEIKWFTGIDDFDEAVNYLRSNYHIPFISLTLGRDGSIIYYRDLKIIFNSYLIENTIDATGAGDTFAACILDGILRYGLTDLDEIKIKEIGLFASASSALITTKKGALAQMPDKNEVAEFIYNFNK